MVKMVKRKAKKRKVKWRGKIVPGPQWAQRCFADPVKFEREGAYRRDEENEIGRRDDDGGDGAGRDEENEIGRDGGDVIGWNERWTDVENKTGDWVKEHGVAFRFYLPWRRWMKFGLAGWGQWIAMVLAVGGVLLNNARIRWCFPLWFVSNVISLAYHLRARLWGLAVRDAIFTVLAIAGWIQWGGG